MSTSLAERGGLQTKEAIPFHGQNSFVGFVTTNQDTFRQFAQANRDLRNEVNGWRESASVRQIIDNGLMTLQDIHAQNRLTPQKARDMMTRSILRTLDSGVGDVGRVFKITINNIVSGNKRRLTFQKEREIKTWGGQLDELAEVYDEARRPIIDEIHEKKRDLMRQFGVYLRADERHLFDFADFISGQNYASVKDGIKPFLTVLAEDAKAKKDGQGVIDSVATEWMEKLKTEPSQWILERYLDTENVGKVRLPEIKSITREGKKIIVEGGDGLYEMLMFSLALARKINPKLKGIDVDSLTSAQIAALLPSVDMWPKQLRNSYSQEITKMFSKAMARIRTGLERYSQESKTSSEVVVFQADMAGKNKTRGISQENRDIQKESKPIAKEDALCPVGVVQKGIRKSSTIALLSDKQISAFVRKEARKIGKNTADIIRDVQAMVLDLRKNRPYGMGIKKLSTRHIIVDQQSLVVRSLDPRKRPTLELSDPNTHSLRVDFALHYPDGATEPTIVIDGIYNHDEHERDASIPQRR